MLDLPLGSALLDALPAHCQLVLVGESIPGLTVRFS